MGLHSSRVTGENESTYPSVAMGFLRESYSVEYLVASEVIPQRVVRVFACSVNEIMGQFLSG